MMGGCGTLPPIDGGRGTQSPDGCARSGGSGRGGAEGAAPGAGHFEEEGGGGRTPAELTGHAEVVAVRPVVNDLASLPPDPGGVGYGEGPAGLRDTIWSRA